MGQNVNVQTGVGWWGKGGGGEATNLLYCTARQISSLSPAAAAAYERAVACRAGHQCAPHAGTRQQRRPAAGQCGRGQQAAVCSRHIRLQVVCLIDQGFRILRTGF